MASSACLAIGVACGLLGCSSSTPSSSATGQAGAPVQAAGGASAGSAELGGAPNGVAGSDAGGAPAVAGSDSGLSGAPSVAGSGDTSDAGGSGGSPVVSGGAGGQVSTPQGGGSSQSGPGCAAGMLFCDDFESYTTGSAPNGKWKAQVRGSAQAVVDTTMAYSGTRSVHFTGMVDQNSANIIAQSAPTFPIQGDTLFIRVMMYVKGYPATSGTHTRFMRVGTNTNGANGTAYAVDTYNGTGIEHVNSGMYRNTSLKLTDDTVKGKWVCWEWEIDNKGGAPSGDSGTVNAYLWRDGTAVPLTTTHDSLGWDPIPFQMLEIGLEAYQTDAQAGDFWIDDVVLNSTKIGCPTKP